MKKFFKGCVKKTSDAWNYTAQKTKVFRKVVAMQFRDVFDMSWVKSKKQTLIRVVFYLAALALYTFAVYFLFSQSIRLLSNTSQLPNGIMIFLFTLMTLLSTINCTVGLTNKLYFGHDNAILLTIPAKPNTIFLSKLVVYYFRELIRNFTFTVPLFIAYGLVNQFSFGYYPLLLFLYFFITLLPVLLGAILSIPALFVSMFLRNRPYFIFIIYAGVATFISYLLFLIVKAIPSDFNLIEQFSQYFILIRDFLESFAKTALPFAWLTKMIVGSFSLLSHTVFPLTSLYTFLGLIGFLAACVLFVFFVSRPLYYKMASRPFEYNKKNNSRVKSSPRHNQYFSALKKEFLTSIRTPDMFVSKFLLLFLLPMTVFVLNSLFMSMDTRPEGDLMCLAFNLLMIMVIVLSFNIQAAEVFSNEGRAFYQFKTAPMSLQSKVVAKLTMSTVITVVSIITTAIIYASFAKTTVADTVYMFSIAMFLSFGFVLWCATMDLANPQWHRYNNEKSTTTNPNLVKGAGLALIISFAVFGFAWMLFPEGVTAAWIKLLVLSIVFAGYRLWLFWLNAKVKFKEL